MSYLALASSKVETNRPVVTSCEVCSEYTESALHVDTVEKCILMSKATLDTRVRGFDAVGKRAGYPYV
ncbi:hypothetical protein J6590_062103 [Homalodisca vitripennis]|nr:hypothetical protein J6590_062103 [Homalodisca vitripennis]